MEPRLVIWTDGYYFGRYALVCSSNRDFVNLSHDSSIFTSMHSAWCSVSSYNRQSERLHIPTHVECRLVFLNVTTNLRTRYSDLTKTLEGQRGPL